MLTFQSQRALCIGEAMVEMAPLPDGTFQRGFAGDTFNSAWHMAQMLPSTGCVGFASQVGTDALSDALIAEARAVGLSTDGITRSRDRTIGLYVITLDGVERSFQYWRDTSAARQMMQQRAKLQGAASGCGLVLISGITLAILDDTAREDMFAMLAELRATGCRIAFDPNVRPRLWSSMDCARDALTRGFEVCDIVLPSFDDEAETWGDPDPQATIERIAALGPTEIVVKNGADACHILAGGASSALSTAAVAGIVDTTGAGDAFNAGYLAARLIGTEPARAVGVAQATSAAVIRTRGARLPIGSLSPLSVVSLAC